MVSLCMERYRVLILFLCYLPQGFYYNSSVRSSAFGRACLNMFRSPFFVRSVANTMLLTSYYVWWQLINKLIQVMLALLVPIILCTLRNPNTDFGHMTRCRCQDHLFGLSALDRWNQMALLGVWSLRNGIVAANGCFPIGTECSGASVRCLDLPSDRYSRQSVSGRTTSPNYIRSTK